MPKLSIIIPIYNVENYLAKCLNSILAQKYTDWECLLINDCSTDQCELICQEFCKKDARFKYIKKPINEGLGFARNTGLDNATGEYVSFIDSDDSLENDFYTTLLPYAEKYGWVRTNLNGVDEADNLIRPYQIVEGLYKATDKPFKLLSQDRAYDLSTVCTCIFKRELINTQRFDKCRYGEDYIFSLELFAKAGQIYFKKTTGYRYLLRPGSLSNNKTVDKFQLLTFLNSFTKMLRRIKNTKNYAILKDIYINNFENRAYVKDLCHNGIDYVFPFVDGTDPVWQKAYLKAKGAAATDKEVNAVNRYRPNDYLKYLFRGIEKNLPWINKIHLIVANESQIPNWIDKDKIHIVLHEDIIPAKLLPTFNSSTIEMFYNNIVGLSDRFIYGNDDMFVLNPCDETDFFNGNIPQIKMLKVFNTATNEVWRVTFQNSYKLATNQKQLDGFYMAPEHTIAPYTKDILCKFSIKHQNEIVNSCTTFRAFNNLNIYMYADYAWANNLTEPSSVTFKYISNTTGTSDIKKAFNDVDTVCINDTDITQNANTIAFITSLFEHKFNKKSIYELGSNKTKLTNPELFKLPTATMKTAFKKSTINKAKQENNKAYGQANTYLYF